MPKPRTPSYRLHKASGRAVVTLNGHDHYLGTYGSPESRSLYDRLVAEWLANGRRPLNRKPAETEAEDGPSVADVVVRFLEHASRYYVKNGKQTAEVHGFRMALRPLVDLFAELPAHRFSPRALKQCREWLAARDLSRSYLNRQVNRIRHVFRWAVAEELVPPSVIQALQAVEGLKRGRETDGLRPRETEPVRPVDEALVDATLPFMPRQVAAMVRLQLLTGMRPGEVVLMRTGDVDRNSPVWTYRPMSHKTEHHDRRRIVPLGPKAQEVLRPWLKADPEAFLFSPREAEEERRAALREARKTPLTPSQRARKRKRKPKWTPGERYRTDSYRRAITLACDKAFRPPQGLQGDELAAWRKEHRWHPNQLRHAFATRVRRERGLEAAQVLLGHSRADVTEVYAQRNEAVAIEVAREIG